MPTLEQVRELLMQIEVPPKGTPLLKAGWIRDLLVEDDRVSFAMVVPTEYASAKDDLARQVEAILKENFPEAAVSIKALAAPPPPMLNSKTATPGQPRKLEGVDTVIAVASGKGGVGKSTVAVHLALALQAQGLRVGLFDGDVYGPSVATMLGIRDAELRPGPNGKILPPEVLGLRVVSMAFFADESTPIIWRGAMIHKAYEQLLFDLQWAPLDVLIIDLPPGTGDPQLSLVQLAQVTGAVIVTTPQRVALADVKKATRMFEKVQVPVLGFVENMSGFRCPHCGEVTPVFGQDGGRVLEETFGAPVLARIPLDPLLMEALDRGEPLQDPEDPRVRLWMDLARQVLDRVRAVRAS